MNTLLDVDRLLVVIAHYDDEALFCGGTLLRLAERGADLHLAVITAVEHSNAPEQEGFDTEREQQRQRRRLAAFQSVCGELGAATSHLGLINLRSDGSDPADTEKALELQRTMQAKVRSLILEWQGEKHGD